MASGGARARSGPPPDPNALVRERDAAEWVRLPSEGRTGDPPSWPLTDPTERELHLWGEMWAKPQAVEWERMKMTDQLGLYVRSLAEAEVPDSRPAVRTLVRQMGDALGLTIPGMRSLRWVIADSADDRTVSSARSGRPSARDRFKVVDGDAGA